MRIYNFLSLSTFVYSFIACIIAAAQVSAANNYDLVNLHSINSNILINMRYATTDNPLGSPLYPSGECYLVTEVAYKLSAVQRELEKIGYGLKVWDAYRPYNRQLLLSCAQKVSFDSIDSCIYSLEHCDGNSRGTSVDVTLVCSDGCELRMPTDFGYYCLATSRDYGWLPANVYHHVQILEKKMVEYGFAPSPNEWWHFDYRSESCYPVLDVSIIELNE